MIGERFGALGNERYVEYLKDIRTSGERVVDLVVTDLAVFAIDKHGNDGMALIELADGVTLDEVKAKTEAEFRVALKNT